MNECALSILCHETCKRNTLPLAMLKLNSALSHVELSDSAVFYSCPHFFPCINVYNTNSAFFCSSKRSRNICMTLRPGVFTQQLKEHYNNTQFFYHALPRALQRPPISVFKRQQVSFAHHTHSQTQSTAFGRSAAAPSSLCHRVCFRVSASAWSTVLSHSHGSELLKKTQYHFLLKSNPLSSWLHWENCPQTTQALNLNTLSSAVCGREFPG